MRILDFADGFVSSVEPTSVSYSASSVSVTPSGNLASTTAQAAFVEHQTDIDSLNANKISTSEKGVALGVATLDASGLIPSAQIPALALVDVSVVADIAARDALVVQEGDIAYVTAEGKTYVYDGSTWILMNTDAAVNTHNALTTGVHGVSGNVVGTSDAQVLTNKDIDGGTASNTNRITLPKGTKSAIDLLTRKEGTLLYATDQQKAYVDNGSQLVAVGSGSGGSKNYITGGDFESGSIGSVFADTDATTGDLTGGSPTATIATTTTSPLSGTASGVYTPGAQYNGWSALITLDREDLSSIQECEIAYEFGTYASYTDGDLKAAVYDVTTGARLGIIEGENIPKVSGPYKHRFKFQTHYSSTSYRVGFVQSTATTSWASMKFEIKCGPQITTRGAPATDWESWTPTGSWTTNTTYTGQRRQVGDAFEARVKVAVSGAPNATPLTINLPGGMSINTTKVVDTGQNHLGWFRLLDAGVGAGFGFVNYSSTTSVSLNYAQTSSASDNNNIGSVSATAPMTWASGDYLVAYFSVPIEGWSSSTLMSSAANDSINTVVMAYGPSNSAAANAPIVFPNSYKDTVGGYSTSTGQFTAKASDFYRVTVASDGAVAAAWPLYVSVNGDTTAGPNRPWIANPATTNGLVTGSAVVWAETGQTIDVRCTDTYGAGSSASNVLQIERMNRGSNQIAASTTIAARYKTAAGQSLPNGTVTVIDFGTKDYDYRGSVTTGSSWRFVATEPGLYEVEANTYLSSGAAWAVGEEANLIIYKGGAQYSYLDTVPTVISHSQAIPMGGSDKVRLLAGEYIDIRVQHNVGTAISLTASGDQNHVAITRIGNY